MADVRHDVPTLIDSDDEAPILIESDEEGHVITAPLDEESLDDAETPKPDPNCLTIQERDNLYYKLHPIERTALKGERYYVPLYTALHQTRRWCGNPGCHRPVSPAAKCTICRTLFCGDKCRTYIHTGQNRVRKAGEPASWCGRVDQTEAVRNYMGNIFLLSENPDEENYFVEYCLVQQLEEWFMLALALGKEYKTLSTLTNEELSVIFKDTPAYKFVDAAGLDMLEHGVPPPADQGKKTVFFKCGRENILPDAAGLIGWLCMGLDFLGNNASRAAMLMTAAAMVHASRVKSPWADTLFVAISQTVDGIRPMFLTGEAEASPLSIFKADQAAGWPACYYCIGLVPLGEMDDMTRRAMQFSVGLYVTPKDAMVIGAAGMKVGDGMVGYGIISLLRAHTAPKANAYVNHKAAGAAQHLDLSGAERWLRRLNDLTEEDGTAAHRESVIREALAIGNKIKYPVPFPRYRLVTCRVIMNIV